MKWVCLNVCFDQFNFVWMILGFMLIASKPFALAPPSIQTLLELLPPWVLAVPKKKTSHSRKAMRSANKGLKDKQSLYSHGIVSRVIANTIAF